MVQFEIVKKYKAIEGYVLERPLSEQSKENLTRYLHYNIKRDLNLTFVGKASHPLSRIVIKLIINIDTEDI